MTVCQLVFSVHESSLECSSFTKGDVAFRIARVWEMLVRKGVSGRPHDHEPRVEVVVTHTGSRIVPDCTKLRLATGVKYLRGVFQTTPTPHARRALPDIARAARASPGATRNAVDFGSAYESAGTSRRARSRSATGIPNKLFLSADSERGTDRVIFFPFWRNTSTWGGPHFNFP